MSNIYLYSMWNTDFFTLINSDNTKKPFVFKSKNGNRSNFRIEELDFITSRYPSFEKFYNDLAQYGDRYIDGDSKDIIITHKHNGKFYKDELIFNDKMVAKVASQVIKKENTKDSLPIPNSSALSYFIGFIEDIATSSSEYKYLLYPQKLDDVSLNDVNVLSSCVKENFISDDKIVKTGIRSLLIEYREAYQKNQKCLDTGAQNDIESAELDKVRQRINRCIRGSYKVFRDLVAWENRYEKILTKKFVEEKDLSEKLRLFRIIEDMSMEKELREERIDNEDLYKYYTVYRKRISITTDGRITMDNIDDKKINDSMNKQIEKISSFGRK